MNQDVKTLTDPGINLLIAREGCRLIAYRDSVGVWTIGVGHTTGAGPPAVSPGMKITQSQAEAIFRNDIKVFEKDVTSILTHPTSPNEFDAYVSLCYNIGSGAFDNSTTVRKFNLGDTPGAADAILLWNKPPEIKSRRLAEYYQFLGTKFVARA